MGMRRTVIRDVSGSAIFLPRYLIKDAIFGGGGWEGFFICIYWLQPVLHHLGIPRDIYRGCYN